MNNLSINPTKRSIDILASIGIVGIGIYTWFQWLGLDLAKFWTIPIVIGLSMMYVKQLKNEISGREFFWRLCSPEEKAMYTFCLSLLLVTVGIPLALDAPFWLLLVALLVGYVAPQAIIQRGKSQLLKENFFTPLFRRP